MTATEFRAKTLAIIADALAHRRMVVGDNRALLEGLAKFIQAASAETIAEMQQHVTF